MKHAAIDIGSNSVRLLLREQTQAGTTSQKFLTTTRISEGMVHTGTLSGAAMQRTREAIARFTQQALGWGAATPVYCYATSAVREAANGAAFIASLSAIEGLVSEIIPGGYEAQCAYAGAEAGGLPVLDIGGGSTEIIIPVNGVPEGRSVRLGCVTTLELFMQSDPPTPAQTADMDAYCAERAGQLLDGIIEHADTIVGVGGTATQLAMLELGLPNYDPQAVDGHTLTLGNLQALYEKLLSLSDEARKQLPGMDASRSDVIVSGAAILLAVMKQCGAQQTIASDKDGLDGYLALKIQAASWLQ